MPEPEDVSGQLLPLLPDPERIPELLGGRHWEVDREHAAALFAEDPSKALAYLVDQVEQQALTDGMFFPPALREWIVHRLPRAAVEAARRPGPYDSTGLGFVGEIILVVLDQVEQDLLPQTASTSAAATLHKITGLLRQALHWTANRAPAEIITALDPISRPTDPEGLYTWVQSLGFPGPDETRELALALGWMELPAARPRRRKAAQLDPLPEHLRLTADRIQQGAIEALCRLDDWQRDVPVLDRADRAVVFAHAFVLDNAGGFRLLIGYQRPSQDHLDALADDETNTLGLKLIPLLEQRWWDQTGGYPHSWSQARHDDFCADLLRRHKRSFKPDQRERVAAAFDAVTNLEVYAQYTVNGEQFWVKPGTLWDVQEAGHRTRNAKTSAYVRWRPGEWWATQPWRDANRYLGHISHRFLQLDHRSKWATRIALYCALLARRRRNSPEFSERHEVTVPIRHVFSETGFNRAYGGRPGLQRRAFEDALDVLVEKGLLAEHDYAGRVTADWRRRDLVLRFPPELAALPGRLQLPLPLA